MRVSPLEVSAGQPCTASLDTINYLGLLHPSRGDEATAQVARVLADRRVQAELLQPLELLLHARGLHLVRVSLVIVVAQPMIVAEVLVTDVHLGEIHVEVLVDRGQ